MNERTEKEKEGRTYNESKGWRSCINIDRLNKGMSKRVRKGVTKRKNEETKLHKESYKFLEWDKEAKTEE